MYTFYEMKEAFDMFHFDDYFLKAAVFVGE
jgi:hypothetical protein